MKPFDSIKLTEVGADEFPILANIADTILKRGRSLYTSVTGVRDQDSSLEYAAFTTDSAIPGVIGDDGSTLGLSQDFIDMLIPSFGKIHSGKGTWLYIPHGESKIQATIEQNENGDIVEGLCAVVEHSNGTTSAIRLDAPLDKALVASDPKITVRDLIGGLCVLVSFFCDAIRLYSYDTSRVGILQRNLKLACSVLALQMGNNRLPKANTESEN